MANPLAQKSISPILSSEQKRRRSTRNFFMPSRVEIQLYFLLSLFLLLLANSNALLTYFTTKLTGSYQPVGVEIGNGFSAMVNYLDQKSGYRAAGFIFWLAVGLVVYLFFWVSTNLFTNLRNDFIAEDYRHPPSFNSKNYWQAVMRLKAALVLSVIWLIVFLMLTAKELPRISDWFYQGLTHQPFINGLPKLVLALVVACFLFYVLERSLKAIHNFWLAIHTGL